MRTLVGALVAVLVVCAGCTGRSDSQDRPTPTPAISTAAAADLASLDLDWPRADGRLDVASPPAAPGGFSGDLVARMADELQDWATATTVDDDVWHSDSPLDQVAATLPAPAGATLRKQATGTVSPGLAVANVFADEVTVVGAPLVTTAWKTSTETDEAGRPYLLLELQTRAAYEVRLGDGASTSVIGVLRVHGLSAYPDTTDDFGVSSGWQEFGAGDCALALDDQLVPDADADGTARDLKTFVTVGDGDALTMPPLDDEEQVDAEYLQRCRNSAT